MTHNILTIRHDVDSDMLADVMRIATFQSIDGWADVISFTQTEDPSLSRMEIIETADNPPRHHQVTIETIIAGMQRIIDMELPAPIPGNIIIGLPQIRQWIITSIKDGDATMIDAYCADAIIQYGLFNNNPYG
jgi:hypothetical protein